MSKRSRRERREGQARRALDSGAPGALESLARSSPEMAAHHLADALSRVPAHEPSALDTTAEALCATLRHAGKLAAALQLATSTAHRSARLRLEGALAAFTLGNDPTAERTAAADPRVTEVMAPLLDAARSVGTGAGASAGTGAGAATGVNGTAPAAGAGAPASAGAPAGANRTAPAAGAGAPAKVARRRAGAREGANDARAALHEAAATVKAIAAGNTRTARAALRRIPDRLRGPVLADELGAAVDLVSPRARVPRAVSDRLTASAAVRGNPAARELLVRELARHDVEEALFLGARLGLPADVLRPLRLHASAGAAPRGGSAVQAALELARTEGAGAFDPEHRAAASLYEGFALAGEDARRAGRALDRAVELGADMIEALRGKLLVAASDAAPGNPDASAGERMELGMAADRFARAVRHAPMGAPFAAAASMIAARAWGAAHRAKEALASIATARATAGPSLAAELDLCEAEALAQADPGRALPLLETLTRRDPGDVRAWRLALEAARRTGGHEKERETLLRAAEATRDPELLAQARVVRLERGELAPFEGLAPGSTTAGALAAEAVQFLATAEAGRALPEAALACRDALPAAGRLAFDVALFAADIQAGRYEQAEARFRRAIEAWWGSPTQLGRLAATAWLLDLENVIVPTARSLAHREGSSAALAALFDAALAAEDPEVAADLLKPGAHHWGHAIAAERRKELSRLRRAESFAPAYPAERARQLRTFLPSSVQQEIDATLAPEHTIADGDSGTPGAGFGDGGFGDGGFGDGGFGDGGFGDGGFGDADFDEAGFGDGDPLAGPLRFVRPSGGRRGDGPGPTVEDVLRVLGLDVPSLTPEQELALLPVFLEVTRHPPTPARIAGLKRKIRKILRTR